MKLTVSFDLMGIGKIIHARSICKRFESALCRMACESMPFNRSQVTEANKNIIFPLLFL